ncbi:hypothetical protein [Herbidospora mongoliensis]|uniref:hypothetical protein n=1 Tax=Herbidospora mongoliensis TaxID=688067 RepID=UPI000830C9EB|nr:hypothetical protein [Herbidospora mongoliensis]
MRKYVLSLVLLGSALFALPGAPAQAQTSGCGAQLDTRKGVLSVVWRLCLEDGAWPHGSLSADCRVAAPFWFSIPCTVAGRFEIQKNGNLVVSGPFTASSDLNGHTEVSDIFTFRCQGPGAYGFAVKDAVYTFPVVGAVRVPDAFVALTDAC